MKHAAATASASSLAADGNRIARERDDARGVLREVLKLAESCVCCVEFDNVDQLDRWRKAAGIDG